MPLSIDYRRQQTPAGFSSHEEFEQVISLIEKNDRGIRDVFVSCDRVKLRCSRGDICRRIIRKHCTVAVLTQRATAVRENDVYGKLEFMKDKATITFSRLASGEVTGEIVNEEGCLVSSRSFGIMSEDEYRKILKLMQIDHPDIAAFNPIELTGN